MHDSVQLCIHAVTHVKKYSTVNRKPADTALHCVYGYIFNQSTNLATNPVMIDLEP